MRYLNKEFTNREDLHSFLIENKEEYYSVKKMQIKNADCVNHIIIENNIEQVNKGEGEAQQQDPTKLKITAVINTTNIYDSHGDVHIDGIWKQSLKSNKRIYLLQEHKATFDSVISRKVKATAEQMTFKELGYNYEGNTQALIFDAELSKEQNEKMFNRYKNNEVDNHSVGMMYVNLYLCIDSSEKWAAEEKANYDKYITHVANKEDIQDGVFWAVTEAKIIEGSAVLFGSNPITPTLETESKTEIETIAVEPLKDTQTKAEEEPLKDTQTWADVLKALK
jgi:hypothetical protein